MAAKEELTVRAGGHDVRVSSPFKVFFSEHGHTKLDLVRYYEAIEGPLMAALGGRPTMLQRFPDGATGKSWFQKRVHQSRPEWVETTVVSTVNGTQSDALVLADLGHLLWAVNIGCLGFHPWPYLAANPDCTDELRIDLDPSPGIEFDDLRAASLNVKALCDEIGIATYVKTSGNRGLHIFSGLETRWDSTQVRAAAVALARELERRHPDTITAKWWKEERGTRVFVDYNQNAPHKTVFGAWTVRPRPGAQVSTPLHWDEVASVDPDTLTIDVVPDRVRGDGDPWATKATEPQSIETLLAWYQRDMDDGLMDAPWPPQYPKMPNEPPRVPPSRAREGGSEEVAALGAKPEKQAHERPENWFPGNLPKPAWRALWNAGYKSMLELDGASTKVLLALHGVGPKAVKVLGEQLAKQGKSLKP